MDLSTFLHQRRSRWRELESILQRVEGSGLEALGDEQAVQFGRLYRLVASDLNQAQTFVSGDTTVQYLNDLVARCYLIIYGRERTDWRGLLRFFLTGYPAVFRRNLPFFLLATALLTAGAGFGYLASAYDSRLARTYLLPSNFPMIQPAEGDETEEQRAATAGQLAEFSSHLFANNVSVSLFAFALGMTYGVGTAWLLWYNGIIMGALAAIFVEAGQFTAFATGILPHGVVEIPAILIGGAAGFVVAQALIRARPWPRLEALASAGREALHLVSGVVPLLAAAALLEAVVARAPDRYLGAGLKLAVAGGVALAFATYVLVLGWRHRGEAIRP